MPPGAAVRTLTLFLTADSSSLNSTLYRSSLEIGRYQARVEAGNAATGRSQLVAIDRAAAAEREAAQQRIALQEKQTIFYAKQMNEEVLQAKIAAAKKLQIEEELAIQTKAVQAQRDIRAVFKAGVTTTLTDIETEKAARIDAIKQEESLWLESVARVKATEIAAAEEAAAAELAIAEATLKKKQTLAYRTLHPASPAGKAAEADAQAEYAAEVARIKEVEAVAIESANTRAAANIEAVKASSAVQKEQIVSNAKLDVEATKEAALAKQQIEIDRIAREAALEKEAATAKAATDIENAKIAADVQIAQARKVASATAAFQTDNAMAQIGAQQAANIEQAEREIKTTERRAAAFGVLKVSILALGLATAAGLAESVKLGIDFEKQIRNVASISPELQASEEKVKALGASVLDLTKSLPKTGSDFAKGLYEITSAGFSGISEGLKVLTNAGRAATAGLTTVDVAAKGLTEVLNAYGLSATEAGRVSDVMFQTVNLGIVTFEQLTKTLGAVIGTAATAGVSIEQLGAAYAAITRAGVGPEETAVSLNRIITSFISPTKELSALTRAWGYDTAANALDQEGLYKVLEKVRTATQGDLGATAALFPEKRALRGVLAALANEGKNYTEVFNGIGNTNASAGATSRALKEQLQATGAQLEIMRNKAQAVGITLAGPILGWIQKAIPEFENFARIVGRDVVAAFNFLEPGIMAFIQSGQNLFTIFKDVAQILGVELKPVLFALGEAWNLQWMAIEKVTGFLAKHKTLVQTLAVALTAFLIPALVATTRAMAVTVIVDAANALQSFTRITLGAAKAAEIFGAARVAADAGIAASATSTATLATAAGTAKLALGGLATAFLEVLPLVAALSAAYLILNQMFSIGAKANTQAKNEVASILKDKDVTSLKGANSTMKDLIEARDSALNDIPKNKTRSTLKAVGGAIFDTYNEYEDALQNRRNDARRKAISEQYNSQILVLAKTGGNVRRSVDDINTELGKAFKNDTFKLNADQVEAVAKKLGVDITKNLNTPESEQARDQIISYYKQELPNAIGAAGKDLSKLTADQLSAMLDLTQAADKAAADIAKTFRKQFDPTEQFKLVQPEKGEKTFLGLEKELATAQKSLATLLNKKKTGGTTANEQDALAAATKRVDRATQDLNGSTEKSFRLFEARSTKMDELIAQRAQDVAEEKNALNVLADLKARQARGEHVTNSEIVAAQSAVTIARVKGAQVAKDIDTADTNRIKANHEARKKILADRKLDDAKTALEIAKRKSSDNPFSEADAAEVERLTALIETLTTQVATAKEKTVPPAQQLSNFFTKQLKDAETFNAGITTLLENGLDPKVVYKLLAQGPEQAADFMKALLDKNGKDIIQQANKNEAALDKITTRAAAIGRIAFQASNSDSNEKVQNVGLAQRIQDAVFTRSGKGQTVDIKSITAELNAAKGQAQTTEAAVKHVAEQFGIMGAVNPATGIAQQLSTIPDALTAISNDAKTPFALLRADQQGLTDDVNKTTEAYKLLHGLFSTGDPFAGAKPVQTAGDYMSAYKTMGGYGGLLNQSPTPGAPGGIMGSIAPRGDGIMQITNNTYNTYTINATQADPNKLIASIQDRVRKQSLTRPGILPRTP